MLEEIFDVEEELNRFSQSGAFLTTAFCTIRFVEGVCQPKKETGESRFEKSIDTIVLPAVQQES
jgi:hypothetical protein